MGLLETKDATFDANGQRIPHQGNKKRRAVAVPTGALANDLARGNANIAFFSERFLGITLHRGQKRFAYLAQRLLEDGYSPEFLDIALASGNRAGKTLILAIVVLHHTFYKFGIRPPEPGNAGDADRWARAPYHWYHISYEGKVAYILHGELVKILTGSHPAQKGRGCPMIDEFGPVIEWDRKELAEYPWIKVHPGFGGGEIHFRHTNEKAKALLGLDMNGISFDEAAFELYLVDIRGEVLHFRRMATGGPIYWISTGTEGYNAFADLWEEGNPENPRRHARAISIRMSTRDNVGYGIDQRMFDDLVATTDEHLIPQNIDGYFIEAREAYFNAKTVEAMFGGGGGACPECGGSGHTSILAGIVQATGGKGDCKACDGSGELDLPDEQPPKRGHRYAQGCDPGISHDATWGITLDYTDKERWYGVRARRQGGRQSIPSVVNMIREGHILYQSDGAACTTIIDETGMGGKMYRQEFGIIRPLRTFDFAGTKAKKLNLLANLKAVIDSGKLRLPRKGAYWQMVRRQLLGYKLDDKKIEQDAVMTLAMAVHHASRNAGERSDARFDYFATDLPEPSY